MLHLSGYALSAAQTFVTEIKSPFILPAIHYEQNQPSTAPRLKSTTGFKTTETFFLGPTRFMPEKNNHRRRERRLNAAGGVSCPRTQRLFPEN
ncbi:MAG: hypothetical protein H7246_01580 [Phycisphaerae bacterium]|nr:hypothetical protein [Saprospiraceae bacterium]